MDPRRKKTPAMLSGVSSADPPEDGRSRLQIEGLERRRSNWDGPPVSDVLYVPSNIISGATISNHGDLGLSREAGTVERTGGYLEVPSLAPNSGMPGSGASSNFVRFLQIAAPKVLDRMSERTSGLGMVKYIQREAGEVWKRAPELVWSESSQVRAIFPAAPMGHMQTLPNLGLALQLPPMTCNVINSQSAGAELELQVNGRRNPPQRPRRSTLIPANL